MDVKKTVTDTTYIALGLGVMGVEQAGATAKELGSRAAETMKPVQERLATSRSQVTEQAKSQTAKVRSVARTVIDRSDQLVDDVRARIAPLVDRLPEPAQKATAQWNELVDQGRARVRGRAA